MRVTGAMLGRQARLAARSVGAIVRQPGVGRDFGRLIASGWRSTMQLRMPWLPFQLIDELEKVVGPGTKVFEYGGGGSTLWFLDRGAHVVTVEHDTEWARNLRTQVSSAEWTLLERGDEESFASYVAAISSYADNFFDVVVVDGRERARCVAAALAKTRPGGLLIVDDVDRDRYAAAIDASGWPRRDIVGFAPAKPTLAYSAVLRRPEVDA